MLPPASAPFQQRVELLKGYLNNNHAYRIGGNIYQKGMIYLDSVSNNADNNDFELKYDEIYAQALLKYNNSWLWGIENNASLEFIFSTSLEQQMSSWLNENNANAYEFAFISVHGTPTSQWFGLDNWLDFNDYKVKPPKTFLMEMASCSNGDLENFDYLAGWALFSGRTLAIIANSRPMFYVSGHAVDPTLHLLSLGVTLGEAIRTSYVNSGGHILFGDPSLRMRAKNNGGVVSVEYTHAPTESIDSFTSDGGSVTIVNHGDQAVNLYYRIITLTSLNGKYLSLADDPNGENSFQVSFYRDYQGNGFTIFNPRLTLNAGETRNLGIIFGYGGPFLPGRKAIPGTYAATLLFYSDSSSSPYFSVKLEKQLTKRLSKNHFEIEAYLTANKYGV